MAGEREKDVKDHSQCQELQQRGGCGCLLLTRTRLGNDQVWELKFLTCSFILSHFHRLLCFPVFTNIPVGLEGGFVSCLIN